MKLTFDNIELDLSPSGKGYVARLGDQAVEVEIIQSKDGRLDLLVDGARLTAYVSSTHATSWVTVNGRTLVLTKSSGPAGRGHGHHHTAGELTAPMPGQVRAVNVGEGETVTKGQTLMLLEAMKMEIRIQSPQDGVVRKLFVEQGQSVEREQVLIEIEES